MTQITTRPAPQRPLLPPTRNPRQRRRRLINSDLAPVLALVLLAIGVWVPRLEGPLDLRYDAGVYYILGTSLAQGDGYRLLNEPGAIEAVQYPPLLSAFVAVHQWALGTADPLVVGSAMRYSYALLWVLLIVGVYALARRFISRGPAFFVAWITLLHADQIWLSDLLHAEMPYTLTTVAFFLLAGSGASRGREGGAWLAGTAAFLLRSAGVAVLVAWVGEALLRRDIRAMLLRAALAAIPVLGWQLYTSQVRASDEYTQTAYAYQRAPYQFYNVSYLNNLQYVDPFAPELGRVSPGEMVGRVATNLAAMPPQLGEMVSSRANWAESQLERIEQDWSVAIPLWLVQIPLLLLGALVITGALLLTARGEWLIPLYLAGSLALIALTPWPGQFGRYLAPLTPLFALCLVVALVVTYRWMEGRAGAGRRTARVVVGAVVAGILILQLFPVYKSYQKRQIAGWPSAVGGEERFRLFYYTPAWKAHEEALGWLAQHAQTGDVVGTSTPHWFFLRTGTQAVMPPFVADPSAAQRLVESVPLNYLVIDELEFTDVTRRYALPMVRANPQRWELVYAPSSSGSRIYRRIE